MAFEDTQWLLLEPYKHSHYRHKVQCKLCTNERLLSVVELKRAICKECKRLKKQSEVVNEFDKMSVKPLDRYEGGKRWTKEEARFLCLKCNTEFNLIFDHAYQTIKKSKGICPRCNSLGNHSNKLAFKDRLKNKGWDYLKGNYETKQSKIEAKCNKCGSVYTKSFSSFMNIGCRNCQVNSWTKYTDQYVADYFEAKGITVLNYNKNNPPRVTLKCNKDDYEWSAGLYDTILRDRSCPKCIGAAPITLDKVKSVLLDEGYQLISNPEYINVDLPIIVECPNGHQFRTNYHAFKGGNRCAKCNSGRGKSKAEGEISEFLESLGLRVVKNILGLGRYEIDLYLPDLKIGIEYNGTYYHSLKSKVFHQNKFLLAKKIGITLLQIHESDYNRNKNGVLEALKCRLLDNGDPCYEIEASPHGHTITSLTGGVTKSLEHTIDTYNPLVLSCPNDLHLDHYVEKLGGEFIAITEPNRISDRTLYDSGNSLFLFKPKQPDFLIDTENPDVEKLLTTYGLALFEDEYINYRKPIDSLLKVRKGQFESVSARACEIRWLSFAERTHFANCNFVGSKSGVIHAAGLTMGSEILFCAMFGSKNDINYLIGFCSVPNMVVHGGLSRCLKFNNQKVLFKSDNRLTDGHLLLKAGFQFIKELDPEPWHIRNGTRFNKQSNKRNGHYIMTHKEEYTVYDAGYKLWSWEP